MGRLGDFVIRVLWGFPILAETGQITGFKGILPVLLLQKTATSVGLSIRITVYRVTESVLLRSWIEREADDELGCA